MDLTTATPTQIDTLLAAIDEAMYKTQYRLDNARRELKRAVDGLGTRAYYRQENVDRSKKAVETLGAELEALRAEREPLDAEFYRRGGWSRFWLVKNHGGHIHNTMDCSTCNNGRSMTRFGWLPKLSGLTEADAVAAHGALLCTVCFPSAPVEWTDGRRADDHLYCPGGGTSDYPVETARRGYVAGNYGMCSHCGSQVTLTSAWRLRKHKKP